ncbi:uncharacterized protein LOC126799150 [Argentina anserina]|uniref:uncharacterized protein LOC126799150 n=1 Tax=Argentina anserina TaxID=57926 RepID=UPI0021761F90|nr:uncharacterized protein LOC126799150 [Potentilla anserina]
MSKLGGLLRTPFRSTLAARPQNHHHLLPSLLRDPPRRFSTAAEQPPQNPAPGQPPPSPDATVDQFVRTPNADAAVYGKLIGITRNTLKTDIVNLLEGCNLTLDDVKVQYNTIFVPNGMMVQFRSQRAFENAIRVLRSRGLAQMFRLERSDRQRWESVPCYDGKTVLIQGLPLISYAEDVERFLSGTSYQSSSIKIFLRQAQPEPIKAAVVLFPSPIQAMNAYITRNRGYIRNNQVLMRVLQ